MPETIPATSARLGKYVLDRRIASGGMADVYLARQVGSFGFVKSVALKVLKVDVGRDRDHVRMFLREALVGAGFHHPNLVQVYEVGEVEGRLVIAMELVRGLSLATLMVTLAQQRRSIPIPLAARIALDALDGLAHAHEAVDHDGRPLRLVHRDVTPQNILLGADGVVKVVDFGIARAETVLGRTQAGRIKGKFNYMAPEQWEPGSDLDARADLFALGVVLYEMSTGSGRLFRGTTAQELYQAVVRAPIPPPRSRVPDYPDALGAVVMKALARDPAERWASARAMHAALARAMETLGWDIDTRVLARLVEVALGGRPVEEHWDHLAAGDGPADDPTMVEEASIVNRAGEPGTPVPPPAEVALGPTRAPARGVGDAPRRSRPALAAALAGWAVAGVALGLWAREERRGHALAAQLAANPWTRVAWSRPVAAAGVETVVLLADPPLAANVAGPWGRALELETEPGATGADGARLRTEPGNALDRLLLGDGAAALTTTAADGDAVARARAQGFDLRAAASARVVGYDHAVVVVHPSNPLPSLTMAQLAALFSGAARSFAPFRGADMAPRVVVGGAGSPTRALLAELVLADAAVAPGAEVAADEVRAVAAVASDPRAVALVRLPWVTADVRVVPVAGAPGSAGSAGTPVAPTRETVRALSYPLARPVMLYTRAAPIGAARALVRVATSPEGQSMVERAGYVSR